MKKLIAFLLLLFAVNVQALPTGCAHETGLAGRTDVLLCEGWTSANWWQTSGYHDDNRLAVSVPATGPDNGTTNATCFNGGPCLDVLMNSCANGGGGGALSIVRDIPGSPDEVWMRYYIKLATGFLSDNISTSACGGGVVDHGGKFPGLADATVDTDPGGQCGNGGDASDGLNCWSGRMKFDNCRNRGATVTCFTGSTVDSIRIGWYWYLPAGGTNGANTLQEFGAFDQYPGDNILSCANGVGSNGTAGTSCGQGVGGITNNVWHLIELHVKMNTVGSSNGIAEGYVDGVLKYRKTNVVYRLPGNRGLHVRTAWLNVHLGGEFVGTLAAQHVFLANLVVSSKRAGAFGKGGVSNPQP